MKLLLALLLAGSPAWAAPKAVAPPVAVGEAGVLSVPAIAAPGVPEAAAVAAPQALPDAAVPAAAGAQAAGVQPAAGAVAATPRAAASGADSGAASAASQQLFDGGRRLHVMMTATEAVPFVKTGGLADVVDVLARQLARRGHQVTLVLPKFKGLHTAGVDFKPAQAPITVWLGGKLVRARVLEGRHQGVDVKLIEHDGYYGRDGLYGYGGGDFDDNAERFAFYNHAALTVASGMERVPDVIHAHDWQAALAPAILKLQDRYPALAGTKTVLTIHNLAFQGLFPFEAALQAGFDAGHFTFDKLEYWGKLGFLKSGIAFADKITTVSKTYRDETLQTHPRYGGMGHEGALKQRGDDYVGVTNPVDPQVWNPATDHHLAVHYDVEDAARGKGENKERLQHRSDLAVDRRLPLFGVASRLTDQKGIDLVVQAAPRIVSGGGQLVVTGNGDAELTDALKALQHRHPRQVFLNPAFSETFARSIFAASDFLLMPSRFEPGGLSNVIAQRYGSLPIVSPTGGLLDATKDIKLHSDGDGFVLREVSAEALAEAIGDALALHASPDLAAHRRVAMQRHDRWLDPVDAYEALYLSLVKR